MIPGEYPKYEKMKEWWEDLAGFSSDDLVPDNRPDLKGGTASLGGPVAAAAGGVKGLYNATQNHFNANPALVANPFAGSDYANANGLAQQGFAQQQAFLNALQAQGGLGNQSSVFSQQQALANQLGQQAQGQGPNPALAQFNQATGQNVANQAALMAGQRGANANAGLIARQAGMQGANIQQQAAGQSAIMQANQQLAAQQQLAQQQAQMAGLANNQVGNQANAISNYGQLGQSQRNSTLQAANQYGANQAGAQGAANSLNASAAAQNASTNKGIIGGLFNAAGTIGSMAATGGASAIPAAASAAVDTAGQSYGTPGTMYAAHGGMVGPQSHVGKCYAEGGSVSGVVPGKPLVNRDSLKNDVVDAKLSPGEVVLPLHVMQSKDPAKAAAEFVRQVMAKKGKPKENFYSGGEEMEGAGSIQPDDDTPIDYNMDGANPGGMFAQQQLQTVPALAPEEEPMPQMGSTGSEFSQQMPQAPVQADISQPQLSGLDALKSGMQQQYNAIRDQSAATSKIFGDTQADLQKQSEANAKAYTDWEVENKKLAADVAQGHVDPTKFVGNMSTPQKVGTAIGLILGGIGSGLAGGENPAIQYLHKQIDQDIDAQKANIGNKQNLLSINLKQLGNMRDAQALTKANMLEIANIKLKQAEANAQDPIAKARLATERAKIDMSIQQAIAPIKQRQQVIQGLQQGTIKPEQAVNVLVDPKDRDEARKELASLNSYKTGVQNLTDLYKEAQKIGSVEGSIPGSKSKAKFGAIRAQISMELRKQLKGQGPISDRDAEEVINPLLPEITNRGVQVDEKLGGATNMLKGGIKNGFQYLNQYGIPADTSVNHLTSEENKYLKWAKQNPGPKADEVIKRLSVRM